MIQFIKQFWQRKGMHILSATVISKIASFIFSLIVIRLLTKEDYGYLMYAYTVVSFIMPFKGMGIHQSFVKYAPIQQFLWERKSWFGFVFRRGMLASGVLVLLLIAVSPWICYKMPGSLYYLISISVLIISLFLFELVKSYLRIFFLHKAYARLEITQSIITLLLGSLLTYLLGAYGYILALVLVPLFLSVYLLRQKDLLTVPEFQFNISPVKIWKYGIYTSLGGLVSQLIFSVDVLSIGMLMTDANSVAQYKALSIIPFSLLFLPQSVIKTDFVKLVQKATDPKFLTKYVFNFMLIFLIISAAMLLFFHLFGDLLLQLFGKEYSGGSELLIVFVIGVVGAYLFRVLYGNLLVAIGWSVSNTIIAIITLLLDVVLNYFWVQQYGILGAAYATSLLLWFSGISTALVFWVYIYRLKKS